MMITSDLNFESSCWVIIETRMVLTATGCSPRSVALYTVPNLRWWGECGQSVVRVAMRRGGSVDHHLRAFAKLAPLLDVVSAKVNVAVVQVGAVQKGTALRHDLIYQLFGRVELVL